MGRARIIKPEFFRSRSLANVSRDARMTFVGLWAEADDAGRGIADSRILKGAIWPLDDDVTAADVSAHLAELADTGHIQLYEADGDEFYLVVRWEKHQAAAYRRGEPKHPDPPGGDAHTSARGRVQDRALKEGKGIEGKCMPLHSVQDAPPPPEPDTFPAFWSQYPRKENRVKAATAWKNLTRREQDAALAALPAHVAHWQAEQRKPRLIPHATTWLHGKRWEDEIDPPEGTGVITTAEGTVMFR